MREPTPATRADIEDFVAQRTLAVVGAARQPRAFGHTLYRELKAKGYRVFPVNPNAETIDGDRAYPSVTALPEPVDGAVVVVPRAETEGVVRAAQAAGITRVWIQQRSETEGAVRFCQESGLRVVHGECLLMHAQPAAFHKLHRFLRGVFGRLPR
jgi:hypothetical protein